MSTGGCNFKNGTSGPSYDTLGFNYSVCGNGTVYVPAAPLAPSTFKSCEFENGTMGQIYDTTGYSDTICFQGVVLVEAKLAKKSALDKLHISTLMVIACVAINILSGIEW